MLSRQKHIHHKLSKLGKESNLLKNAKDQLKNILLKNFQKSTRRNYSNLQNLDQHHFRKKVVVVRHPLKSMLLIQVKSPVSNLSSWTMFIITQ